MERQLTHLDYCIVAFAIIIAISTIQWLVDGHKNFTGPRADMLVAVQGDPAIADAGIKANQSAEIKSHV